MDVLSGKLIVMCVVYFIYFVLTSSSSSEAKSGSECCNNEEKEPQLNTNSKSNKTESQEMNNRTSSDLTEIYFQVHFDLGFPKNYKPIQKIYTCNSTVHDKLFVGKEYNYSICLN